MNRKRTCVFDFWYFAYLGHFGSGNEPKNAIFQIWPKIWPKQAKYQKSKKQVLFLFIEANLLQRIRSIGINVGEYIHFLGNFNIRFSWFFQYFPIELWLNSIRGVWGVRVEIFFFGDSDSKFSVLSPAFYRISKSWPEAPQFCGFVGVGEGP